VHSLALPFLFIIQIALHLKLCVAPSILPFLCGCMPEQERPILYPQTRVLAELLIDYEPHEYGMQLASRD
jgi:hypothetical protein